MPSVNIDPGVCQFMTKVSLIKIKKHNYEVKIDSECPHLKEFANEVQNIDLMEELRSVYGVKIQNTATKHIPGSCAGCLVPISILKVGLIDAGLALPRNMSIIFED